MAASTWTLSLLLVSALFSCFHSFPTDSTSVGMCKNFDHTKRCWKSLNDEFNDDVDSLNELVKSCSENCSLANVTDQCKCLNISLTEGETTFPSYFIKGLKTLQILHPDVDTFQDPFEPLIRRLTCCSEKFDLPYLSVAYEPIISPKRFGIELETVKQKLNINFS